jgi:dihydroxy-acid dehydratase
MADVDHAGGIPVVMQTLLDEGLLHGEAITVTGRTVAQHLADIDPPDPTAPAFKHLSTPLHSTGGLTVLRGSLAPDGTLVKSAGMDNAVFTAPNASSTESDRRCRPWSPTRSAQGTSSSSGTKVRRAAPACGRCWPSPPRSRAPDSAGTSCSSPTGASQAEPPGCASDTSPREAVDGGPSALVRDGDSIRVDLQAGTLDVLVSEADLIDRRSSWTPPAPWVRRGVLAKYARTVGTAAQGAVCG